MRELVPPGAERREEGSLNLLLLGGLRGRGVRHEVEARCQGGADISIGLEVSTIDLDRKGEGSDAGPVLRPESEPSLLISSDVIVELGRVAGDVILLDEDVDGVRGGESKHEMADYTI